MRGLLTAADVARLLKLHPNSVYRLVRDGALVATRLRGSLRFTEADVQAFVERQRAVPARVAKREAVVPFPQMGQTTNRAASPAARRSGSAKGKKKAV